MDICSCACPNCKCEERCLCCPTCCSCTECIVLRKSLTCSKCKEQLNTHTRIKQIAAAKPRIEHSEYPGVDFSRLPDLSFLSSNVPREASGNRAIEAKQTIKVWSTAAAEYKNPTVVKQDISESKKSEEQPLLIFPMEDVIYSSVSSEMKDLEGQTSLHLRHHASLDSDETASSITFEYSQGSQTEETSSNRQSSSNRPSTSAPSQLQMIECLVNDSLPCRLLRCPFNHLTFLSQEFSRLCKSYPLQSSPTYPFFVSATSAESITLPQSSAMDFSTSFMSFSTTSNASQTETSVSEEIIEYYSEGSASDQSEIVERPGPSNISPRVSLCPLPCDPKSQVREQDSSATGQQSSPYNLISQSSIKENSSQDGTSLVQQKNTEVDVITQQFSEKMCTSSSKGSSSQTSHSSDSPVFSLGWKSDSSQNDASNSSTVNNNETSNLSTSETVSEIVEEGTPATPVLESTFQAIVPRTFSNSNHVLTLLILLHSFRHT